VGDWILYYEPRREGADLSGRSGRQCYFATARVERIEADPKRGNHFYAYVSNYLEFTTPVRFREEASFYESALRKSDGSTNKGRFGRAVRLLAPDEYRLICEIGFAAQQPQAERVSALAEEPIEYSRSDRVQLLERPFRDAAFTRTIQTAYESTCAMTGLRPVADDGPDSPRNGLALSRTVHWMFDRGILSVSDLGEILLAKRLVPDPVRHVGSLDLAATTAVESRRQTQISIIPCLDAAPDLPFLPTTGNTSSKGLDRGASIACQRTNQASNTAQTRQTTNGPAWPHRRMVPNWSLLPE
jgi:putative restriction endonuclease